jgi:hypothetical protein
MSSGEEQEGEARAPVRIESAAVGIDPSEQRRRRALMGVWASAAAFLGLCVMIGLTDASFLCGVGYIPCLSGLLFLAAAMRARRLPLLFRGAVYVHQGRLWVQPSQAAVSGVKLTARSFPLDDVAQGFWESPDRVHLVLRGGETVVARAARADGDRLLHAAGVSPADRVLRVPLVSAAARIPAGPSLAGVVLGALFLFGVPMIVFSAERVRDFARHSAGRSWSELVAIAVLLAILGALGAAVSLLIRRREAVLGTDGVQFRGAIRRRFYPYASLVAAEPHPRGVRLDRRRGRPVVLPSGRVFTPEGEVYRDVLLERIRAGIAGGGGAGLAQVDLDRLERRGRTLDAWRNDLASLLGEHEDYRKRGLSAADLGAVIEDAGAPVERRVAAAVALGARRPDEARRRVRIATQAAVDDDLRLALERAAEGEIEAAAIEREARRRGSR